ncbi:MAG TPA: hypothetical protein VM865_04340 [Acidobacteriaceae bacterium]|jgi:mannose-6-phosphate isomerase-like protein (cupin superfamily)|nr:hypothetical protein [Acidobacteriaceae bacterium]
MKLLPLTLFATVLFAPSHLPAQSASPSDGGVKVWPKGVPPEGITHKENFGNHILSISHRTSNGRVEVHQKIVDVLVIQSGEADLVTGGEVVEPVSAGENEMLGSSIRGGVRRHIGVGDVLHIPAGVPHQFFIAPGTQITYLVVKVSTSGSGQ